MSVLTTATQELQLHPALNLEPLNCIWSTPVSELDPTHTSIPCSPSNCWIHPISEMQGWCHEFCQPFKLNALYVIWLVEQSPWRSWAPHCIGAPRAVAELPDRPWLRNTQEGRAVTGAREPFKANHDLPSCSVTRGSTANSNSPFPQSKPSYQLQSFSWAPLDFLCCNSLQATALTPLAKMLQSRSHYPFATTNISPFKNISLGYQWGQKKLTGDRF